MLYYIINVNKLLYFIRIILGQQYKSQMSTAWGWRQYNTYEKGIMSTIK